MTCGSSPVVNFVACWPPGNGLAPCPQPPHTPGLLGTPLRRVTAVVHCSSSPPPATLIPARPSAPTPAPANHRTPNIVFRPPAGLPIRAATPDPRPPHRFFYNHHLHRRLHPFPPRCDAATPRRMLPTRCLSACLSPLAFLRDALVVRPHRQRCSPTLSCASAPSPRPSRLPPPTACVLNRPRSALADRRHDHSRGGPAFAGRPGLSTAAAAAAAAAAAVPGL